ncbi:MAG: hypothetical protein BMS9Abin39_0801 [Ignavibacteria bacterium]|nr:MAG: hypothetical protein BMS9Abin39_0801 [Ignavibacteria bacterium]
MKKLIITAIAILIASAGSFSLANKSEDEKNVEQNFQSNVIKMTVYRTATCHCCGRYIDILKKQGYEIEDIVTDDMNSVKEKFGIPYDKQSCHTVSVDNYFIEGHVPMDVVKKLLEERPEIDGIGLPGMRIGTPGMPGVKRAPFEIFQAKDGEFSEYLKI